MFALVRLCWYYRNTIQHSRDITETRVPKKVTPYICFHNSNKQRHILTKFHANNPTSNCNQTAKFPQNPSRQRIKYSGFREVTPTDVVCSVSCLSDWTLIYKRKLAFSIRTGTAFWSVLSSNSDMRLRLTSDYAGAYRCRCRCYYVIRSWTAAPLLGSKVRRRYVELRAKRSVSRLIRHSLSLRLIRHHHVRCLTGGFLLFPYWCSYHQRSVDLPGTVLRVPIPYGWVLSVQGRPVDLSGLMWVIWWFALSSRTGEASEVNLQDGAFICADQA